MNVSEEHAKLAEGCDRLFERLSLILPPRLPRDKDYLRIVPALHAIVDRLEAVERLATIHEGVIATMMGRLDKLETPRHNPGPFGASLIGELRRDDHASTQNDDLPAPRGS